MSSVPQTPEELQEQLFVIFPEYRAHFSGPFHDGPLSFHSVLLGFTPFLSRKAAASSPAQLKAFGELVNEAVGVGGELENACGTCLLEHFHQIGLSQTMRPFLSKAARLRTRV